MRRLHVVNNSALRLPVVDADRSGMSDEVGRVVIDGADALEPYLPATDDFATVPVAISHSSVAGVVLEVGPFDFDHRDVARLRVAIERFHLAGGGAA